MVTLQQKISFKNHVKSKSDQNYSKNSFDEASVSASETIHKDLQIVVI